MNKYVVSGAIAFTFLTTSIPAIAASDLSQKEYAAKYKLFEPNSPYWEQVEKCISVFPEHPFKNKSKVRFRVIEPSVKIFGLGANVTDETTTDYPQLILIRSAVNIMSKSSYRLMNPNGWYCFTSKVNVMGKTIIKAACDAHIVTTKGNTTVLGKSVGEQEGTTVMGKSIVERVCD